MNDFFDDILHKKPKITYGDLDLLPAVFKKFRIELTQWQQDRFFRYWDLIIQYNDWMNLTSIVEWKDVIIKHFLDSCVPYKYIPKGAKVIDVGSGAGFPGIPLAIIRQDIEITLLDSLEKRINFLDKAIFELNLPNVKTVHSRAEDYARLHREEFDCSVSRAVAGMDTLAEYCLPLTKVGGVFIAYKGNFAAECGPYTELAIEMLGGKIREIDTYYLTKNDNFRTAVVVDKVELCPIKYPRGQNKPRNMSLEYILERDKARPNCDDDEI